MKKTFSGNKAGFSLIEILVATTILVIIVMMMSTIFHQSSIAWDAGTRRAQGNMMGRSLLGIIARDLASAVIDTNLFSETDTVFPLDRLSMTFVMLAPSTGGLQRVLQKVSYAKDLNNNIVRNCSTLNLNGGWNAAGSSILATNLGSGSKSPFVVTPYYLTGADPLTTLPDFVEIQVRLKKSAEVSSVGARSFGPNGKRDTDEKNKDYDDIRSY